MWNMTSLRPQSLDSRLEPAFRGVAAAIGTPDIDTAISNAICTAVKADRLHVYDISRTRTASTLHSSWNSLRAIDRLHVYDINRARTTNRRKSTWSSRSALDRLNQLYISRLSAHDPVQEAVEMTAHKGAQSLLRFSADNIDNLEYRDRFFDSVGIHHRMSLVCQKSDSWLVVSLGRQEGAFSEEEGSIISGLTLFMDPLLERHHELAAVRTESGFDVEELERRFAQAHPDLTERERQVCARTVAGITAEGAGIDIGITTHTVLTYRRRAYAKLGVVSASELSSRVLF